ncbi:CoA transferase, partial [Aequoribacter sp.]
KLTEVFKAKTRDEWCAIMEGTDVCFAPVLSFKEAPSHPANIARNVYQEVDGVVQPSPAPRFSRTPSEIRHGAHGIGEDTVSVLQAMGFAADEIEQLQNNNSVA